MAVRVRHYVLTLTGAAQQLAIPGATPLNLRLVSVQPGGANANPVFIGAAGVTTTDYGVRLPAASGAVPPPPYLLGEFDDGTALLEDFYVIGTNTEKLHLFVITHPGAAS